jgi:hypothetical protein
MSYTTVTIPQQSHSTETTIIIDDTESFDDLHIITIQTAEPTHFNFSFTHRSPQIYTSTPFVPTMTPPTVIKNPTIEGSILKTAAKPKLTAANKKKVVFVSPQVMDISSIDEQMRKSVYGVPLTKTPVRPVMRVRPRSLTYSDAKKRPTVTKPSRIPTLKRLSSPPKPVEEVPVVKGNAKNEGMLKGVKMNRRFELLMKSLHAKKF